MKNTNFLPWVLSLLLLSNCVTVNTTVKSKIKIHPSNTLSMLPILWLPAAIAGAAAIAGGLANAGAQQKLNRKNREWSEKMYERQKNDSLAFWAQQNSYNSPQAQMERFKSAGLNPNLIYGQGNAGNAGPIPTPDTQRPELRAPEWGNAISGGASAGLAAYYDTKIKNATTNNLELQGNVLTEEAQLKKAQIFATLASTDRAKWDLMTEKYFFGLSADMRRTQLEKAKQDLELSARADARAAAQNASSLSEALERMLTMQQNRGLTAEQINKTRQEIQNLKNAGVIQKIDAQLKKQEYNTRQAGGNPNDPMYAKIIAAVLTNWFNPDGTMKTDVKEKMSDWKTDFWEKLSENQY